MSGHDAKMRAVENAYLGATVRASTLRRYTNQLTLFLRDRLERGEEEKVTLQEIRSYIIRHPARAHMFWAAARKFLIHTPLERTALLVKGIRADRQSRSQGALPVEPRLAYVAAHWWHKHGRTNWATAITLQSALGLRAEEIFSSTLCYVTPTQIVMEWHGTKTTHDRTRKESFDPLAIAVLQSFTHAPAMMLEGSTLQQYEAAFKTPFKSLIKTLQFSSHGVRVGTVTEWLKQGIPRTMVQRRIGWAPNGSTITTYNQPQKLRFVQARYSASLRQALRAISAEVP